MVTPYRGIVRLSCLKKGNCPSKIFADVKAGCVTCESVQIEILDLDNKVVGSLILAEVAKPKEETPILKLKSKKKED